MWSFNDNSHHTILRCPKCSNTISFHAVNNLTEPAKKDQTAFHWQCDQCGNLYYLDIKLVNNFNLYLN